MKKANTHILSDANLRPLSISLIHSEAELDAINNGILHIHAVWSGPAVGEAQRFLRLITELEIVGPQVYVIDNDLIQSPDNCKRFNHHGYGETHILKEGEIIFSYRFGQSADTLRRKLAEFSHPNT
ncbi:MAG: hypothetical protein AAF206_20505 [Bacteroidota bacterium]